MQDKTWEFTSANLVAMLSAVLIMFAFIFLPWYGSALTENGARILSDNLYGSVGAKPAPLIWLIPIVSLGGILFGLFGIFSADRSRPAALICLGLGLIGLGYFGPALKRLSKFWGDEAGANLLEYALILFLVSIGIIISIASLGTRVRDAFLSATNAGS